MGQGQSATQTTIEDDESSASDAEDENNNNNDDTTVVASTTEKRASQSEQTVVKVVLFGRPGVGKTSMIKRLQSTEPGTNTQESFRKNIFNSKTILDVRDTNYKNSIDRYVLPLYTIGCNVVLLCYDMTSSESFNELQFFLDFLDKENKWGGVLYAFVGLKSDLEGQRRVHQYQVKELANSNQFNASFFEVSSVDPKDNSVEEMFLAVARKWLEAQGCELQDTLVSILCCSIAKDVDKSFGGLETLKATLPHELYLRIEKSITRHIEEDEQEALTPLYD
eukprot:TRINITY_DN3363_c0_g1_i1.p1 TRINITY_DN3363_c0_g1~~TRINITY_DN3363_c0_g1_i1.p1  ORF type:complete len:279 (-),score=55.03 TRINITY_DN3363_c0_g1_i1:16-852(-)